MDSVVGVFGGVAVVVAIAWAFWSLAYNFRRGWVAKKQAEVQLRLLERLGTGAEVLAYLQSPQGQPLLDAIGVERGSVLARIMGSVQAGLILVLLGSSLLLLRLFVADGGSLLLIGVPTIAVGLGFLGSSAFSFRLSRSLGLIHDGQATR
ncbi:MAG: hypothetical protein DMG52_34925 [Acidobacteria bacterium]|nr:MAG: hypothetical protein DMG52_34925 [Acidobacteriota bacterium]